MSFTIFSFMIALIWCNIYIVAITLLRKRDNFIIYFSYFPLLLLIFVSVFRVALPVEFPHTIVLHSEVVMTTLYDLFSAPLIATSDGIVAVHVYDVLMVIWAGGSLYFLLSYAYHLIRLKKNQYGLSATQDTLVLSIMDEIVKETGYNKKIKVIQSPEIVTPMVTGFFYPTIYMPDMPLTDAELKYILQHELTHFLHKDAWIKLFMYLIVSIFWWNPFVHFLNRDLNHILEIRCDLGLTAKMGFEARMEYLESVLKVVKRMQRLKSPLIMPADAAGLAVLSSTSKIEQRFNLVLHYNPKKRRRMAFNILLSLLILLSIFISYTFVIQPDYSSDEYGGEDAGFSMNLENAYLMTNEDGTYAVYMDGQHVGNIDNIDKEPFLSMSIKQ